jgi:hypothetical protein
MIFIEHPGCSIPPEVCHALSDPGDWPRVLFSRAEVVGSGETGCLWRTSQKLLSETNISIYGFENVLPGTNGMRTANSHRLARQETTDEVWNKAIGRPVASTDDVAGAGSREGNAMFGQPVDRKVRLPESSGDDLGARFRTGVWIIAAKWIGLTVGPHPLLILITFVGRD